MLRHTSGTGYRGTGADTKRKKDAVIAGSGALVRGGAYRLRESVHIRSIGVVQKMSISPNMDALRGARVAVLGDIIVDHYVRGNVSRVSEEAPVPILHVSSERFVPGGAANVAANVAALGGSVILIGAVGEDASARRLSDALKTYRDLATRLVAVPDRPTTLKTRYLGGNHQIVRVDREEPQPVSVDAERMLIEELRAAISEVSILVLSDYAKGVLSTRVLEAALLAARSSGVRVIVDPKHQDFGRYRGASVITPNRKELTAATGLPCGTDEDAERAAALAIEASGADILLTRSELGMSYFRKGQPPLHSGAEAKEVFDVSGAGDTVVAAFGLALAAGFETPHALRIANVAAGIAVGKYGTSTVSWAELNAAIRGARALDEATIAVTDPDSAVSRCAQWRAEGLSIGLTNGCFDVIHPGHIGLIQAAANACDRLVVALNSDESITRLKGGKRPAQRQAARAQVVASIKGVSLVTVYENDTPRELIRALRPDVLIKGNNYREEDVVGGDVVREYGGSVLLVDTSPEKVTEATAPAGE